MPFYVVVQGRKPGIYESEQAFRKQLVSFSCSYGKRFYNARQAKHFAKQNDVPSFIYKAPEKKYVVFFGKKPGVYSSESVFRSQLVGYSGALGKSFKLCKKK